MFIITILAFIVGAVATYLVVVVGFTVAWDIMGVHDQDGGGAMALGLVIGPACAVIGGLICAIFVSMWVAKRRELAGPTTTEERRRDVRRFFITGGTVGAGYIGYELALLIYWYVLPSSIGNRWLYLAISWAPIVTMALGALAGRLIVGRMTRPRKGDHPEIN